MEWADPVGPADGAEAHDRVRGRPGVLLRNRTPFPTPGGLSLCQGLGDSHRSPCSWRQPDVREPV